ncbi:hypothetical protein PUN28_011281 [Cardiocondyla obscurior]|uniref:Uncharacterized protein n=1 Tax=Cardiocondyla obscurior TaxID=286306 RepID=A0AAW2FEB3_9HYME
MKYLLLILVSAIVALGDVKLNVVFKWNYANFTWESREQMQAAVDSGNYSPLRSLMYDATKADDGRVFITLPKEFGPGTPATLATVSNIEGPGGLLLSPYPDWSWHNSNCTCNRFTNIHRVDVSITIFSSTKYSYFVIKIIIKITHNLLCIMHIRLRAYAIRGNT